MLYQLSYTHHGAFFVPTFLVPTCLARPAGLEPATHGLEGRCSIQLSYGRTPTRELVGARGFEPPTPCSQSRCATGLRHAPSVPARTSGIERSPSPGGRPRAMPAPGRFSQIRTKTGEVTKVAGRCQAGLCADPVLPAPPAPQRKPPRRTARQYRTSGGKASAASASARPRCDREFFSSGAISANVRECPSGRNSGS